MMFALIRLIRSPNANAATCALWFVCAALPVAPSLSAQDRPPVDDVASRPASLDRGRGNNPRQMLESLFGDELEFIRPQPQDNRPVADDEEGPLLTFARDHFPRAYRVLITMKERRDEAYRRRLNEFAPRLRHLRRLYERSPEIGNVVSKLMTNFLEAQPLLRKFRSLPSNSPDRAATLDKLRGLIGQNVQLESQVAELKAADLQARRVNIINRRFIHMMTEPGPPAEFADLVKAIRECKESDARSKLETELKSSLGDFLDEEISLLRERSRRLKNDENEEIEARVRRLPR